MNNRLGIGYEPNWDIDLADGKQGELIVLDTIKAIAEGRIRVEVKRDSKFLKTGRLYVEHEQNPSRRGVWKPSGLPITTAQSWAFLCADGRGLFIVDTPWLRRAVALASTHKSNLGEERDGGNPTRGICIQLNHLTLTRTA